MSKLPISLQLGMQALDLGRYAEATELLEGFCRNYTGDRSKEYLQAQMSLVKAYRYNGRSEDAIDICHELAADPSRKIQSWAQNALKALEQATPESQPPESQTAEPVTQSEDAGNSIESLAEEPLNHSTTEITASLDALLAGHNLSIQVIQQEQQLLVILNRAAASHLDYNRLSRSITDHVLALQLPDIYFLVIYSRVLGEFDPDWQTQIDLQHVDRIEELLVDDRSTSEPESIVPVISSDDLPDPKSGLSDLDDADAPDLTGMIRSDLDFALDQEPSDQDADDLESDGLNDAEQYDQPDNLTDYIAEEDTGELDLTSYCFVRNKHLVTTTLPNPDTAVAQAVLFFHLMDDAEKRLVLPTLVEFFKAPDKASIEKLPPDMQQWLTEMRQLNDPEFRSVSVWLSRYCADPDPALAQIDATLTAAAEFEAAASAVEEASPDTEQPTNRGSNRRSGRGANNSAQASTPPASESFAKAGRSSVIGATLAMAGAAGKLGVASAVTISLLFGMVMVLCLAVMLIIGKQNPLTGLAISIVASLAINAAIFFLSPFIMDMVQALLYQTRWVKLTEIERYSPEAAQLIKRVCNQQKIQVPRLGIIDDQNPTAFTYGALPNGARLVVSKGIFTYLDDDEVATVYAHELGHIAHWDFAVMTLASTLVQITYLIYIFAKDVGDRFGDRAKKALESASMLAYVFYVAGTYILLYLSRTREYYADHFAAEVTGNPNALSRALVKIAYGILEESKTAEQPSRLMEGTRALGIYDAKAAGTTGTAYQVATDPSKIGRVFLWDLFNPWGWWMELSSTHPLTGKRVRALGNYAEQLGLDVEYDMAAVVAEGNRLNKQRLYKGFAVDLVLSLAEWIGVVIGLAIGIVLFSVFGWWKALLSFPLILFGIGVLIKIQISYPGMNRAKETNILELMSDPYASPLRAQAVKLAGAIIGRGDAGSVAGSDLKLQDNTGLILLRFASRFGPIGNFLFGANQVKPLIGNEVRVSGWFRRGVMPWVDLNKAITESGKKVDSFPTFWPVILGLGSIALGVFVIPNLNLSSLG